MTSENGKRMKVDGQYAAAAANITGDDFISFHEAHFGGQAVDYFGNTFFQPNAYSADARNENDECWDEEDDLGYYEDGVKRTLTDEQIAIFRHSELQQLKRKLEKEDAMANEAPTDSAGDGFEASSGPNASALSPNSRVGKKKKKKKGKARLPPEPKPDLRKRTWDIVEKGLDSLDYD